MPKFLIIILISLCGVCTGQNNICFCDEFPVMNSSTVNCDTLVFKNDSKIYWQFNCDSVWLTLENRYKSKTVINQVPLELYGYTYRIGYHLIKEFSESLLFRHGCPATGPCDYSLLDKTTGKNIMDFGQLICIDTDIQFENAHEYKFDFVVYLNVETAELIIYFINSNHIQRHPFKEQLTLDVIPSRQFNEMNLKNDVLTINYTNDEQQVKIIDIKLKDK